MQLLQFLLHLGQQEEVDCIEVSADTSEFEHLVDNLLEELRIIRNFLYYFGLAALFSIESELFVRIASQALAIEQACLIA